MEYDHGHRVTQHIHEMTPLERAITEFEERAKSAHNLKIAPKTETEEQRLNREQSLCKAMNHLKAERALALAKVQVQTQLDEYRAALKPAEGASRQEKNIGREAMTLEKHHPTDTLAKFMRADGRPKPAPNFTPHHIVQGKGRTDFAYRSRVILHSFDIRINDPDNGAWMPSHKKDKGHWAMPNAMAHSEIHTHNYEEWVFREIRYISNAENFNTALIKIRLLLRDGRQPESVSQPPMKNGLNSDKTI